MNDVAEFVAEVTLADVAYDRMMRLHKYFDAAMRSGDYRRLPSMDAMQAAEQAFLAAPAETADSISKKLFLAETYLDETGCYTDRDALRLVIRLVQDEQLDDALRYACAIVSGDADDFCYAPILAAIADMEALV